MVMTLTDEEIRVKVAELMGWIYPGSTCLKLESWNRWIPPKGWGGAKVPDYLNDPAAALQLCDRMHSEGWNSQIVGGVKEKWAVTFHRGSIGPFFTASDPSLARAVTLCFLKCHE